ncbi:MAG: tail fiber domain-containing protein [Bacteroidota bacterium]
MKKSTIFLFILCLPVAFLKAQNVAINATGAAPAASAMLDVATPSLGILVPRVALTAINAAGPITLPATSLLVYNTATAGAGATAVSPGFYYWDGAKWVSFGGQNGRDWSLTGNPGTVAGTNFLGTTDAIDLVIKTNNTERMRFLSGGSIGIGTTVPNYALEMRLGVASNYIASFENTTASGSGLLGYNNAGLSNALGGVTNISSGIGVYGVHLPNTGNGIGVYGTSNSSNTLGVRGSIPTAGAWLGYGGYFSGGLGYANGLYNLSDSRVKSNVVKIENAIEKLKKIEGVTYKYNAKDYPYIAGGDTRTYLGFIAQNVYEVFPEAVAQKAIPVSGEEMHGTNTNSEKTKYETFNVVDYTAIVPVLVEAIKEQQKQIEELKSEVQKLKLDK